MVTEDDTEDSVFQDSSEIYCKKLGHMVPFSYCQTDPATGAKPGLCPQIRNCWHLRGNIDGYLESAYSEEMIRALGTQKVPKAVSLFDLIKKASKK